MDHLSPLVSPAERSEALESLSHITRGLSRRDFLRLSALGAVSLGALGVGLGGCTPEQQQAVKELLEKIANRPVRKDINSLANDDPILEAYRKAVDQMKALPSSDKRNWPRQADIHRDFCPHGNWLFLPWHRAYLWYFEEICRELSGMEAFALPYWNWQKDPQIPAAFWGGASNPLFNSTRTATQTSTVPSSITGPPVIESILDEPNFLLFASGQIPLSSGQRTSASYGPLEGTPHNSIHGFVGGNMGNYMSPLDPVFWTHHNMVEAIWVEWNWVRSNPNTNDSNWVDREFTEFVDRAGNPVQITVTDMLLFPLFNYRFDEPVLGVP